MAKSPDPRLIPYPGMQPPRFAPQMTTQDAGPNTSVHWHCAFVDYDGNGATTTEDSHFHTVRKKQIMPAEDGHTHNFAGTPCGAGGVRPMTTTSAFGMMGIIALGASQASQSVRQSLVAQRRARLRLNFALQALKRRGCVAAQEALQDAKEWVATSMNDRRRAGLVPMDGNLRVLVLDMSRIQIQINKSCRRG